MITIAFFNNKSGAGKTSLVYHLAWMYADHGVKVVAAEYAMPISEVWRSKLLNNAGWK